MPTEHLRAYDRTLRMPRYSHFKQILKFPSTRQVRAFVERSAALCQPEHVHVCDGSEAEAAALLHIMQQQGTLKRLPKYDNW